MKMGLLHLVLETFEGLLGVMKCTQRYIALGEGLHLTEFLQVLDRGDWLPSVHRTSFSATFSWQ